MTRSAEFEGKTLESAVEEACRSLGVDRSALRYTVLSRGSSGIFGLVGARKARIRAEVPSPPRGAEAAPADAKSPGEPDTEAPVSEGRAPGGAGGESGPTAPEERDPVRHGREVLGTILEAISPDAELRCSRENGRILFQVRGGNAALLIGKRGQTLAAIHYLMEKIVNRHQPRRVKVLVDVEGYLENKKENLRDRARRLAEKAVRTGKPSSVGQMNAHDRRIVHLALKDEPRVRTQSLGEGALRKLVIFPKKTSASGRGKPRRDHG